MTKSLIEQIEEAVTKEDLEPLAEQLGVEINKREGVETIRAKLLEAAETKDEQGGDPDGDNDQGPIEPSQEKPAKATPYKGRLLKHRKNGRTFPWTAQLAKKRDMQEV
ncbi:MAG: hypothetical protein ACQEW0_16485 [Pseudomonadota bacterium]